MANRFYKLLIATLVCLCSGSSVQANVSNGNFNDGFVTNINHGWVASGFVDHFNNKAVLIDDCDLIGLNSNSVCSIAQKFSLLNDLNEIQNAINVDTLINSGGPAESEIFNIKLIDSSNLVTTLYSYDTGSLIGDLSQSFTFNVTPWQGQEITLIFEQINELDNVLTTVDIDNVALSYEDFTVVPVPGSLILAAIGVSSIMSFRRRRN